MGRKKLSRFEELETMRNVVLRNPSINGKWSQEFFGNDHPLTLELGCGRGEYSLSLAQMHPDRNFLGIDIKGARLWQAGKRAEKLHVRNVGFLQMRIDYIADYFAPGEVDEIWITFPDPQPRRSRESKRLTSERYLDLYKKIAAPDAIFHFKTDNTALYKFTLDEIQRHGFHLLVNYPDLYSVPLEEIALTIQTRYECKHLALGSTIKYIRFQQ